MANKRNKRSKKNLLLMAGFQGRVFFFIILTGFICIAINAHLYYLYVVGSYDFILRHANFPQDMIDDRYSELFTISISLTMLSLLTILLIATWTLFITHRAAGPVYHMNRVINEIRAGNTQARVQLRKKDEFQDLAKSFNELMDELHNGR
jgi:HAMP domain-containing protein